MEALDGTRRCMPLETRQRVLSFSDEQAHADLERRQQRVDGLKARAPAAGR